MHTLEELIVISEKNQRICLQPGAWDRLWKMLPNKKQTQEGWRPPLPLILSAWWDTPHLIKTLRLREHLAWAVDHGFSDETYIYLSALDEKDWYHGND